MIKDFKAEIRRKEFKKRYELQLDKTSIALLILLGIALLVAFISTLQYIDLMMSI